MRFFVQSVVCLLVLTVSTGDGYPTGAPPGACATMTPRHNNVLSQACQASYTIVTDQANYDVNNNILVTVRPVSPSDNFKGILLTAKTEGSNEIVGTWSTTDANFQELTCDGTSASTGITHRTRDVKTQASATWTAPSTLSGGNIVIRATVVRSTADFYVSCFSVTLTARQSNQSTSGTISTTAGPTVSPIVTTVTTTTTPASNVGVNIGWTFANGVTAVKMSATNLNASQWFAFALSTDESMGDDHVFMCKHLPDNTVSLVRMINPDGYNPPVAVSPTESQDGTFTVTAQKFENGVVSCEFTLSNFASSRLQRRQAGVFALTQTASYHPLIAIGKIDSPNTIRKHTSRLPLSQLVQLNRQETIDYNPQDGDDENPRLMKAHGILMIFAWIVFVSTGVLIAQFFKTAWPERKICGKAVWFTLHRVVMSSAAILTIIAFILILVFEKGRWISRSQKREFAHSIVGIIVISFAVVQPILAVFRCAPDGKYRFIFNYVHGFIGYSAFILSIVAIFLAMLFTQFDFRANNEWGIVVAWICWAATIYVVFLAVEFYFRNHATQVDNANSYDMNGHGPEEQPPKERTKPKVNIMADRIKTILLVLHILVALGLAIALAVLVGGIRNK